MPASTRDPLPPTARRLATLGVLMAHVAGVWALLQVGPVRSAVHERAPIVVDLIAPPPPPPPPAAPPPAPRPRPVKATPPPPPPIAVAAAPEPQAPVFVAPPPPPVPPPAPAEPEPAPPSPPAPPAIKRVSAASLQYLVLPPVAVPAMSRRLGESGTVVLRVIVDRSGAPRLVALHRSSGHPRLDDQALGAMRAARFRPCTDDGVAIECEAIAPVSYILEN